MDGGSDDVELLLASTRQELADLRTDPRFGKPPKGSRGAGLYEHVQDLLAVAEIRMDNPPDAGASDSAREAFARNLREAIIVLREANHAIPWLTATRAPHVNLGSLYLSEELTELLVGKQADLVFVPGHGFMYSTISWPFSEVINATQGYSPKASRRPIVVNYPRSDSDRLLLHPLFAHEIAHSTVTEFSLLQRFGADLLLVDPLDAELKEEAAWVAANLPFGKSELKLRHELREILRSWVKEILCDLLAAEVSGPAFLWAAAAFGLPLTRSGPSETHPPTTLRVKLVRDLLVDNGWGDALDEAGPRIDAMLTGVAEDADQEMIRPWEFLRTAILANIPWLRKTAKDRVGASALKPAIADEARSAAALLERLVLPVASGGAPFKPRAILLAGWLEGIRRHGDDADGLIKAPADRPLQDLVGKAIEMSTVMTSWEQQ